MRGQILKGNDGDGVGIRVSGSGVKIAEGIQHLIIAIGRVSRKIANVAGKDIPLCIDVQLEIVNSLRELANAEPIKTVS